MGVYTVVSASYTLGGAALFFAISFINIQKCLRYMCSNILNEKDIVSISMRCVSAIQGISCCVCGLIIITECKDLVYESHWLTDTYVLIGTGYLVYDTWATYTCYSYNNPSVQQLSVPASIINFIKRDPAMMFHHIGLPFVYLPVVMYYRGGVGDGLIGCFMMIEATVPFISFREILVLLKMSKTCLYFINGVLVLTVYTLSRIVIFPWMFWLYGRQIGRPWYEVPFLLKRVCIGGTAVFLGLYVYWWFMIMGIARQEIRDWFGSGRSCNRKKSQQPDGELVYNKTQGPVNVLNKVDKIRPVNDSSTGEKGNKIH